MKFKKGKCKVLPLWSNNPMHQYMLTGWKAALLRRTLGSWWSTKMIMSRQGTFMGKKANSLLGCTWQSVARGDPLSLLCTVGATSGVLCPILGSPVQERQGPTQVSPVKHHKDGEGTGASFMFFLQSG